MQNARFSSYGDAVPYRPVEDLAFAVARFFQRGGTFQNYYMVLYFVALMQVKTPMEQHESNKPENLN